MLAKKCDRCKGFFDRDTTFIKDSPFGESKFDYTKIEISYERSNCKCDIDLCPKCAENLYEWMSCRDKLKEEE